MRKRAGFAGALCLFCATNTWATEPPPTITNPHWAALPTIEDLEHYVPAHAVTTGVSGAARLSCIVTAYGYLNACEVIYEAPTGYGFGQAAISLSRFFRMTPKIVDGRPVTSGRITVPIRFNIPPVRGHEPKPTPRLAERVPWLTAPTAPDLAAAFPREAVGRASAGQVVLRCVITRAGKLANCDPVSEKPSDLGFGDAANRLAKDFSVAVADPALNAWLGATVDIAFDFRDKPNQQPVLTDPVWLQTADRQMAGRLFPDEAAKTGLITGLGEAQCDVTRAGELTGCKIAAEYPPNLGFGAAALAITRVMRMNIWTGQGIPVDGAKVTVPIRINLGDSKPGAVATDTSDHPASSPPQ